MTSIITLSYFTNNNRIIDINNYNLQPVSQNDLVAIDIESVSSDSNICSICLDEFIDKVELECEHMFCRKCIKESLSKVNDNCPLCRNTISSSIIMKLYMRPRSEYIKINVIYYKFYYCIIILVVLLGIYIYVI
jgi:hypothetical protein